MSTPIQQGIALHGPTGTTGIGYGLINLGNAVKKLGRPCTVSGQKAGWADPFYHVVVDQPAFIERCPWNALVPTFELPLRNDEKKALVLPSPKHRMFCLNSFIKEEIMKVNPDMPETCFPLVQQGSSSELFMGLKRRLRTIGIAGKYEPRKGYDQFFELLPKIKYDTAYALATSPLHNSQEIQEIQAVCDRTGVQLLPWEASQEGVMAFLATIHVFVTSSTAEGWNLLLSEALAQGCIVVASDIHAHRRQYELLKEAIGEEAASYRLRLVKTEPAPIVGHDRWYPGVYYVGKKWLHCQMPELIQTAKDALKDDPPVVFTGKDFPLSWTNAAKRLIECVDEAVNQNRKN